MKTRHIALGLFAAGFLGALTTPGLAAAATPPFTQCPPVGADTTGCGILLTINPDGTVTVDSSGQGPYDGADDTLIGVQNNSGTTVPKLSLSGTTQPFNFDGDGICNFAGAPAGCPFGPSQYEGPGTSFSNIDTSTYNTGDVNFAGGIPAGGSAYFSLEGDVTAQNLVIVQPNRAPDCSGAVADTTGIWPPNHQMVPIAITKVSDPDKGDTVTVAATAVTQDEPLDSTADGHTTPDATLSSTGAVTVRAERAGTGDGRVYVISFTATDNHGATCTGKVSVGVPHDQGGHPAVDSGQTVNSLG